MSMRMARCRSMPPATSTSSMLSRLDESEPVRLTSGAMASMSGNSGERNLPVRAAAQLRLPVMVLISPLWASRRKGWASGQRGMVLVEKRWWNRQMALARSGSARSGKKPARSTGIISPL